jgi:hypothetical protein
MGITSRDKKILAVLAILAALAGYWFLLLSPKREQAAAAAAELAEQEDRRDAALALVAQLEAARDSYHRDYTTVVRLGKAIPSSVDVPSLIVQLQDAAEGTDIHFDRVAAGEREETETTAAPAPPAPPADSSSTTVSTESSTETEAAPTDTQTSQPASEGAIPVGGGTAPGETALPTDGSAPAPPALETVPLDFSFRGSFFDLADFFHEMKRYVHLAGNRVNVQGRLMTIDGFSFTSAPETFPTLTAEVQATVYVSPKAEGVTGGATPAGPPETTPVEGSPPATPTEPESANPTTPPTATATP